MKMKIAGRASLLTIGAVVSVLAASVLLVWSFMTVSPKTVGSQFMSALAAGDAKALTNLSYLEKTSPDEIQKQWEFATGTAAKHYLFYWKIVKANEPDASNASVSVMITRDYTSLASYPEKYDIPLIKQDGKWLVDVRAIDRSMYPAMPY